MKSKFNIYLSFLLVIIISLGLMLYYYLTFSMYEIEGYKVNAPNTTGSLLIATQGSDFKDKITEELLAYYNPKEVYIQVTDISKLEEVDPKKYNAFIIMHTWEYGNAPVSVKKFLDNNTNIRDKIVVLSTSGNGTNKIEGVDAITGESIMENTSDNTKKIINKIEPILNK